MLENDRYAGKKRKKPVQKHKPVPDATKSNPSKRHRDRLNGELDRLTNMLPFLDDVRSRLDKLSVLRLSVGYLKVKSFFKATMRKNNLDFPIGNGLDINELDTMGFTEGDLLLQALSGFVLVVTAEGYVFYASPTIQDYLGFHESDMVHQSVFEFIHVDDRAMFRRQLHFALNPKLSNVDQETDGMQSSSDITRNIVTYDPQHIPPENSSFLERSFVCRFRCLLDNSSGFLKLNFQGRLKFLLGQNKRAEDGSVVQPQLALFAIATPVQPPAIQEIRTKTLFFQTKHKLDFTPMGIDSRGKVVLGYSEIELCMKGTGYQFIHAADLMHCADNHLRMIKTGESGMTVFRLLTKNGVWVWVQANARLIYKGGRPDFIIARQRALVNAEGEEHLRKRSLQLPFSLTTGEAVLYDMSPAFDMSPENNKKPFIHNDLKALDPRSVQALGQKQDKLVYQQPTDSEITLDDVFKDSWALFNVPSHALPDGTIEEEDDTVTSMIDTLEQLAQDGDICSALNKMEVDSTELKEWENALLKMAKESSGSVKTLSLDEILTNDIFSYVEDALYKDINKSSLPQPDAPAMAKTHIFGQSGHFGPCSAPTVHSRSGFSMGHNYDNRGATKPNFIGMAKQEMVANSQRLSHSSPNSTMGLPGHQADTSFNNILNNLSHTEQNGIFTHGSKDSELFTQKRKHLDGKTSGTFFIPNNGWEPPQNIQNFRDNTKIQGSMSSYQFGLYPVNQSENPQLHHLQNGFHQLSQPAINHWSKTALGPGNDGPSLSPCKNHLSSEASVSCSDLSKFPQQSQMQQWQHALPEQPCLSPVKNRLAPNSFQSLETPGFPQVGLLPENSELASNHSSPLSSCMFESPSPLSTNMDQLHPQAQAVTISSYCKKTIPNNQSPPQASCYFQWMRNEPVVGTSSIPQEHACVSPPSCHIVSGITPTDSQSVFQQYQGCNGHIQVKSHPEDHSSSFSVPTLINGIYLPENSKTNCCNL